MPKFLQCDRLPRAPRKRSVPSVNDHPAIVDIFRKFFENGPCIQTISFLVTMMLCNTYVLIVYSDKNGVEETRAILFQCQGK